MHCFINTRSAIALISTLLFALPLTLSAEESLEEIKANCHIEGQGEGLNGPDLEEFIHDCVKDLTGLNLGNSIEVKKGFDEV
ncbi:MAG: hypothetical protein ABW162_05115 [Candidatus Sedimenticola sp. PURPLELP]